MSNEAISPVDSTSIIELRRALNKFLKETDTIAVSEDEAEMLILIIKLLAKTKRPL